MFTIKEILKATSGELVNGSEKLRVRGISTDSRTIKSKELFIALKGDNFDGHKFIPEIIKKSSGAAVVSKIDKNLYPKDFSVICVKDTLKALGDIARFHRRRFKIPIIAITGSCGKTTTKDMIGAVLARKYNVLKTEGTKNNQIGVPQTLLKINRNHDVVVLEFGTNHTGEIEYLSNIAKPDTGVFTNIGASHLEFFGSISNVFKEKYHLVRYLLDNGGTIVYNKDDIFLSKMKLGKKGVSVYSFGKKRGCHFRATSIRPIKNDLCFVINHNNWFELHSLAIHNVYNALSAIAVGRFFGLSFKSMRIALSRFKSPQMRMNIEKINDTYIIDDAYNSNPLSLESAIETISKCNCGGRKIIVCADMLELGGESRRLHFDAGRKLAKYDIDMLITIGKHAHLFSQGTRTVTNANIQTWDFTSKGKAIDKLLQSVCPDDIVLIKGSRSMQLEEVTNALRDYLKRKP